MNKFSLSNTKSQKHPGHIETVNIMVVEIHLTTQQRQTLERFNKSIEFCSSTLQDALKCFLSNLLLI